MSEPEHTLENLVVVQCHYLIDKGTEAQGLVPQCYVAELEEFYCLLHFSSR